MRILIATYISGVEYETSYLLIKAFKELGHEVCIAGPVEGRTDISKPHLKMADIDLPDKPYPETYSYKEVLDKAPWTPDFILQIEPHFYFIGEKPKDIKSYYWVLDPNRGGFEQRNMALMGNFNGIFITHNFFMEAYTRRGLTCHFLPFAFDSDRIKYDSSIQPECDIAFVGETGIHCKDIIFEKTDGDKFQYCDTLPDKIRFHSSYGEYGERAMLLANLVKKFNVRLYKKYYGDEYAKIIQKGMIGFNRSINSIQPRIFQIMALRRALMTDDVFGIEELLVDIKDAFFYKHYGYNPMLSNFELDCEAVEEGAKFLLNNKNLRENIAKNGYELVHKNHTYKNRVEEIIKINENFIN